jgi:hypothetical protein
MSRRAVLTLFLFSHALEQDANSSETNETDYSLGPPRLESSMSGGSGGRIILPLPVPSPHVPSVSRSSTSSGTYDPITAPSVGPPPIPTSQRLSPDSLSSTRLPSITPRGILIQEERRDPSPPTRHGSMDSPASFAPDRLGMVPTSPTSHTPHGGWSHHEPPLGPLHTDSREREYQTAPVLSWMKPNEATPVPN